MFNEILFEEATKSQNKLANDIRKRILDDLHKMSDLKIESIINDTGSKITKNHLITFFLKNKSYRYFINQMNVKTESVIVSAIIKYKLESMNESE